MGHDPDGRRSGAAGSVVERVGSQLAVTAVAVVAGGEVVVAGSGGTLRGYSTATGREAWRSEALRWSRIHGIAAEGSGGGRRVVAFGGKAWAVVDGGSGRVERAGAEADWIRAARWVEGGVAVVLAHGRLRVYAADGGVRAEAQCGAAGLAYAAALGGETLAGLAVALGTARGDVVVCGADGAERRRLRAHDGAVFGVALDGDAVASVSDDRSVRVWPARGAAHVMYGHRARVWQCALAGGLVAAAGEDGTVRVWPLGAGAGAAPAVRRCAPRNAWALAAGAGLLAAGAADGSVRAWPLAACAAPPAPRALPLPPGARACALAVTGWDSAVVATAGGAVLAHAGAGPWAPALQLPALRGYAMAAGCGDGLAALGLRDGSVVLLLSPAPGELPRQAAAARLHAAAVRRLILAPAEEEEEDDDDDDDDGGGDRADQPAATGGSCAYNLVTVGADDGVVWSRLAWARGSAGVTWHVAATLAVPGAAVAAAVSERLGWAAVGTARGALCVFALGARGTSPGAAAAAAYAAGAAVPRLEPAHHWPRAHGRRPLAAVALEPGGGVLTGGHDGLVQRFEISGSALRRVGGSRLTAGWVAQLVRRGGRAFAVTFHNKRLAVVDVDAGDAALSAACSGAVKPWQVLLDARGVRAAFVHHAQPTAVRAERAERPVLRAGGGLPTAETRAVCCAGAAVVAAGDDGAVRVLAPPPGLAPLAAVRRHRSAVRCACALPPAAGDPAAYVLTAGAGGELRCWLVSAARAAPAVECVAEAATPEPEPDLRIMAVAVVERAGCVALVAAVGSDASVALWRLDVAARSLARVARGSGPGCLFSAAVVRHGAAAALVLAGTSRGSVVCWDVSAHVRALAAPDAAPAPPQLLPPPTPLLAQPHQSGVNGLCVRALGGPRFLVATAGDDCRVAASEIALDGPAAAAAAPRVVRALAADIHHASAVQAVAFAADGRLCSVSTDQRLAVWSVCLDPPAALVLQDMAFTHVADPSALHIAPGTDLAYVAGAGLEVFRLSSTTPDTFTG
ncbi:WD repeat-containing protein 6 [Coemansia javaensis]|uniref:WD repeat-containing protein 6 n=1 Tax=Coemansia javaensis TaxID=2761396 RepID=A0A9W8HGG0_9FUNG|nr:WD repeat-containing protein 6 [Coemansia javaensis]